MARRKTQTLDERNAKRGNPKERFIRAMGNIEALTTHAECSDCRKLASQVHTIFTLAVEEDNNA